MLGRIREILLTQYIGAIIVGFLAVDAISTVISIAVSPATFYLLRQQPRSLFGAQEPAYDWSGLIVSIVRTALYLVPICLVVRWLYWQKAGSAPVEVDSNEAPPESGDAE